MQLIDIIKSSWPRDHIAQTQLKSLLIAHYGARYSEDLQYSLVKRALANKSLLRLRRGLYLLSSSHQRHPVNLFTIAAQIYGPSYVSMESALSYHGMIPEAVYVTTSVTTNRSKEFSNELGSFEYRHVKPAVFQVGVERKEVDGNVFLVATPEKALFDLAWVRRKEWNSIQAIMADLRIDEDRIDALRITELKQLPRLYQKPSVSNLASMLLRELQ